MRVVYNVDYKPLWSYLYNPEEMAKLAPLRFCSGHNSDSVVRVVKKKPDVLINTYSSDGRIKNLLTAKQSIIESNVPDGDYLYDLDTAEIIFNFDTRKTVGGCWSIFPPIDVKRLTLFAIDVSGNLHKVYVGNGLATLAFCIYWVNTKFLIPKEITHYGIKATFIFLETIYNLPHYDIRDYEEIKRALHPTKKEPSVPYSSKIYNHLKLNSEKEIPLTLPEKMLSGENITVTKDDRVLLSQIIESGIIPHSTELIFVEMDKQIDHIINVSLEKGELCLYIDKAIYEDQVLLDLGLEDREDVITVAKDAQIM